MGSTLNQLADHAWQSTLFAAAIALLALAFRRNRADVRYWLWFAVSLKFLVPFALLTMLGSVLDWRAPLTVAASNLTMAIHVASEPFSIVSAGLVEPAPRGLESAPLREMAMAIWAGGAVLMFGLWAVRWRRVAAAARRGGTVDHGPIVAALRRLEHAAGLRRPIRLVISDAPLEPGVFGIGSPVLLWPRGIGDRLTAEQVHAILSHEVAHVRRRDNLTAAVHMVAQALFWFHPLVWWVGRRLVDERERACDEDVVRLGSEPGVYAESILKTCQFYAESPLVCVSGVTGSNLKRRIEQIMHGTAPVRMTVSRRLLLMTAAVAALTGPVAVGIVASSPVPGAQDAPSIVTFDSASVRPNDPAERIRVNGWNLRAGRLNLRNQTLYKIIQTAYAPGYRLFPGLPEERMSGGPSWIDIDRFTIEAKAPDGSLLKDGERQMSLMLRALLAERFKLRVRVEIRQLPVYALIMDKTNRALGPQLRPAENPDGPRHIAGGRGRWLMTNIPPHGLASAVEEVVGRPVLDRTGLSGSFDGAMEWTPEPGQLRELGAGTGDTPVSLSSGPSIFTAVREQLGLRLVPETGPVEFLVIERAEHPSEN